MKRIHAGVVAGGLTGLVLITALAIGFMPDSQAVADGAAAPAVTSAAQTVDTGTVVATSEPAPAVSAQDLLEQNARLTQALEVMQAREVQYRQQLEAANLALMAAQQQLDQQAGSQPGATGYAEDGQGGWNGDEGQNHDEHERREHEGFGFEEHDD